MHSSGYEPVTFFRGTILFWVGAILAREEQAVNWGAQPRNVPRWRWACSYYHNRLCYYN